MSIKGSVQEHVRGARDASEAANRTREEIPARLADLRVPADERAEARALLRKQHWQQVLLTWGTWLAFIAAAFYAGVAAFQLREFRRTNDLTQQALASSGDALSKTLTKMQGQIDATGELYRQTQRLAAAAEKANANVLEADRPWFGAVLTAQDALEVGKVPSYTVVFLNSGKRPARVLASEVASAWFTAFPKSPRFDTTPGGVRSNDFVVPNGTVVVRAKLFHDPLTQSRDGCRHQRTAAPLCLRQYRIH